MIVRIAAVAVLAIVLFFVFQPRLTITSNGYMSFSIGGQQVEAAASITSLGTANDTTGTTPWTALSSLSLSADDTVVVCESGDDGSGSVEISTPMTIQEYNAVGSPYIGVYGDIHQAQSFTASSSYTLKAIGVTIYKNGSPSGDISINIYLADGSHYPTGSSLASGSISCSDASSGLNYINVTDYSVSNSTEYVIVMSCPDCDVSNYIGWQVSTTNVYLNGQRSWSEDGGSSWNAAATYDFVFRTYSTNGAYFVANIDATASNSGNIVSKIWSCSIHYTASNYNVIVGNPSDAKSLTAYKISELDGTGKDKTATATGSGDTISSGATAALSQADEVVIGLAGMEEEIDEKGTWTTGTSYVSGNEQDACADRGGAKSITTCSVAEIVSATTAQTAEMTGTGGNDWAACIATYKVAAGYSITNTPDNENIGVVADSSTYYAYGSAPSNPVQDGECTFTITNNGSLTFDIDMSISDFTGGTGWNIVSGSPGSNEVRVTAYYSGQNPASGLILSNSPQEFYDALAASGTLKWDFKMETGVLTDEPNQHTATITITAVAED